MLSSLFPRGSANADIDNETDRETVFDEALEDGLGGQGVQDRIPDAASIDAAGLDPFEQDTRSTRGSSRPPTSTGTRSPVHDRHVGSRQDDAVGETLGNAQVNPFDVEDAPLSPKAQGKQPERRDVDQRLLDHRVGTSIMQQTRNPYQDNEDEGPPGFLMYEDHPAQKSTLDESPWQAPNAAGLSTVQESVHSTDLSQSLRAGPSGSKSHSRVTSPTSTTLEQSQQVPWWLRESRRHIAPSSVKASIPHAGRIRLEDSRPTISAKGPEQLPLHTAHPPDPGRGIGIPLGTATNAFASRQGPIHLQSRLSPKERALWTWVNVEDLDTFLQDVYTFYVRKGLWSIALSNFLDLVTIGFVIAFSTFLTSCVDYSVIRNSHNLSEVVVPRCVSGFHGSTLLLVLVSGGFYALRIVSFRTTLRKLVEMRNFFVELLEIPEADIATISWPVIVDKLSALRAAHPSNPSNNDQIDTHSDDNARLDAHDVANRIMRKENYLIALFNKSVLNLAIPIPFSLSRSPAFSFLTDKLGVVTTTLNQASSPNPKLALLTKTLEWNLSFCLLGFLFGPDGQVRRALIQERNKADLVQALQRRFILMGCLNAIFAPFIVLYLLFYSFFRYFEEYHKNPSSIGNRSYTQVARWKFREFNELPHIFQQRLYRSYPLAASYINQFPNDRTAQLARFVAFISGSFASVLVLFSLVDPDAFLHFEITKDRTVLFYITVFGSILAVSRGMVPDDHRVVDPEQLMKAVVEETHYLPAEWRGKLHSAEVHREFSQLFPLKVTSFFQEILSVLTTPLVLWFTLPRCAPAIIDFFREFTIHVDGLGHVCSFAVFDFNRHGDVRFGAPVQGREELVSEQGKMEKSVLGFKAANPSWQPADQATSMYLSRMTEVAASTSAVADTARSRRRTASRPGSRSSRYGSSSSGGAQGMLGRRTYEAHHLDEAIDEEEESALGGSYVSSMAPRAGTSAQEHSPPGVPGNLPEQQPSMMDLLYEGTRQQQRW